MLSNSSARLYRNLSRNISLWSNASTQCLRSTSMRRTSTMSGAHSHFSARSSRARALRFGSLAATAALGTSGILYFRSTVHLDYGDEGRGTGGHARRKEPLSSLIRSYIVYSMCSIPVLVDASPTLLSYFLSIPIVRDIAEGVVRITFFNQFVGGDTAEDALPLVEALRKENKGALFAYSVEVDQNEAAAVAGAETRSNASSESTGKKPAHKQIVDEMIRCIDVSADFEDQRALMEGRDILKGRRTWVAVKFTALLPSAHSLAAYSSYIVQTRPTPSQPIAFPGCPTPSDLTILDAPDNKLDKLLEGHPLSRSDVIALRELRADLERICERAQERHVKVIIDAEHTWYQPAIDALTLSLMRKFNKIPSSTSSTPTIPRSWFSKIVSRTPSRSPDSIQPLVYTTFQCYLRRTPDFLRQSIVDAQAGGYALGVKLVRGAYHPLELSTFYAAKAGDETSPSISPDRDPPVWLSKHETDLCYNELTKMLIKRLSDNMSVHKGKEPSSPSPSSPSSSQLGILFGTHNWHSCDLILDQLVTNGLAKRERDVIEIIPDEVVEHVAVAQLYGMKDELTNSIVDRTKASVPFVIKYVPYGALKDVMPYLSRRAIENKSVLGEGGAVEERKRAGAEIVRRIFPGFS